MAGVGGVLVAGIFLPVVGGAGLAARKASGSFTGLSSKLPGTLPERSEILDAAGHPLAYIYGHVFGNPHDVVDRVPVGYSHIAPVMGRAIVAIEDSRFYQHGGFDLKGTARAAFDDLTGRSVQGGSTIAQQYVKNVLVLTAKTPAEAQAATQQNLGRKLRELRYAVAVSQQMSKDQLLASYLNVAYFGEQAWGVQVAAQRYFDTTAAKLTLPQAALLAGLVEDPAAYDPVQHPQAAIGRRNIVLARMAQLPSLTGITPAQAAKAEKAPLGLRVNFPPNGCASAYAPFFCDYVLALINNDKTFRAAKAQLDGGGGLRIYTTLAPRDQGAAQHAVDYELPATGPVNPTHKMDTEVMVQPGTGAIRAMAIDRAYGSCRPGCTTQNYAVGPQYDGGEGFQIGSTGKVYTLVTALEQGIPFGYAQNAPRSATVSGITNCQGRVLSPWSLHNDESEGGGRFTLYTGTTASINTFYAALEKKVGLCNVVHTAARMGLTFPDGSSLLGGSDPADNDASFTLGAVNVTPLSVAAADAALPARGIACSPVAVTGITDRNGKSLPVESAGCHRAIPAPVADAANHILQGDLRSGGTAAADGIGRPAASKTGTADNYMSAAFVGYTPGLLGMVVMSDPESPTNTMQGEGSCYRGGCPGLMYGAMGPGKTWQVSFEHADLTGAFNFVPVPRDSLFYSKGDGRPAPAPPHPRNNDDGNGPHQCPTFPFCFQPPTGGGGHGHGHGHGG